MEPDLLNNLSTLGVGGVIAGFMFLFYRRDAKHYEERAIQREKQWEGQSNALMLVVKENTAAVTANTRTIDALHAREDRIEEELARRGYPASAHRRHERDHSDKE